jgi:hypothetical protein
MNIMCRGVMMFLVFFLVMEVKLGGRDQWGVASVV